MWIVGVLSLNCVRLFCDSMDWCPSGSSVHWFSQARILEWVVISFSKGSSWCRDQTCLSYVSCTGRQVLYHQCHLGNPEWCCDMSWLAQVGCGGRCLHCKILSLSPSFLFSNSLFSLGVAGEWLFKFIHNLTAFQVCGLTGSPGSSQLSMQ